MAKAAKGAAPEIHGRHLLFVDVETTGLTYQDRIVTLGYLALDLDSHRAGAPPAHFGHYIFNPGQPSNPFAAAVHGYDDWTLRHQQPFPDHADHILPHFEKADMIVAHNASFDERFIRTAFGEAGLSLAEKRFHCTMRAWRALHGSPAGLDPVITRLGLKSRGKQHGALEDAWLCMRVYLSLNGLECPGEPADFRQLGARPVNWIDPEPRPIRGARKIAGGY